MLVREPEVNKKIDEQPLYQYDDDCTARIIKQNSIGLQKMKITKNG